MSGTLSLAFDAALIPDSVHSSVPAGLELRPLASGDYARGHLDVLRALTSVPDVGEAAWEGRFAEMRDAQPRAYYPLVLVEQGRIVATGTLFLERKFIRALGAAGHIEDIAVDKSQQGKGLGRVIIAALTAVSEAVGAYKTILDCSEENQPFYVKCGYKLAGVEMAKYAGEAKPAHAAQ
ncbi:acyl-CoA N-acyltransferase [Tilletiopsis washingtonensis]|uniref:Glucosamine 6-phosphate N-acetyltransferase n=1 Tax=Tilletiopsis washingtonensis TaxID=58919 RepID=A0A316ZES2_9BASI|nr:acyl-CoA N-acyltransferase [Tilletiopsis washingtonensis]PWO00268.1 acyl-CoA N-acyltransferase [Tilletiopsis washingtonensis]